MKFNTRGLQFIFKRRFIFLVFHRNIGLKTSIYEFSDRIHQNKQGFEGKKLSGKEFVAFEEYQRVLCGRHSRLGDSCYFLTWIFAFILLVILQNPLK